MFEVVFVSTVFSPAGVSPSSVPWGFSSCLTSCAEFWVLLSTTSFGVSVAAFVAGSWVVAFAAEVFEDVVATAGAVLVPACAV